MNNRAIGYGYPLPRFAIAGGTAPLLPLSACHCRARQAGEGQADAGNVA